MARVADGDRAALGTLYDRYSPLMTAIAVRTLGESREAQDLVHDVFLEAWLHASEFDPARGSVRSWLLLRLRSRGLDRLGRAETRKKAVADDGADEAPSATLEHVDRIGVRQAIERLEPGVREVLELTYFRGLTAEVVSREIGVPMGTVRSRLARGLRELRAALTPPVGSGVE
jgi:RNA polymerase sigma-70 factor (ECF subfamily)